MKEDFLHYLWKHQNFSHKDLKTSEGEEVEIIYTGHPNTDAGPDFKEAKIRIGRQLWAGQVEIHLKSSDWKKHGHHNDEAYRNVILHVVFEDDAIVEYGNNRIPAIELKSRFDENMYAKYLSLIENLDFIPCSKQLKDADSFIIESMLERVLVERLAQKSEAIDAILQRNNGDWNETFYQWMARGYGLKVNADPMMMLAQNLPQKVLAKHKSDLFQLEALLFGVSGLLNSAKDGYANSLKKEYSFLKAKYKLPDLEPLIWKYARLRPAAFPNLRIAQFAALIEQSESLFSHILETGDLKQLKEKLSASPGNYWKNHYRFDSETEERNAGPGNGFKELLIINVIVPFLFIYGLSKDESFYKQRALDLLDQLNPESNKITRAYEQSGLKLRSAFHSQAYIQLHKKYCELKKCLNCGIGTHLLKR